MSKHCCKCKLLKDLSNFGKLKNSKDGYRYDCNECRKLYRINNKNTISEKQKEYYKKNKDKLLSNNKIYRKNNSDKIKEQRKEYRSREKVKIHIKQKNIQYLPIKKMKIKMRRKTDINFQISEILRSKIHKMIKGKNTSYMNFVGCDINWLKKWIEYQFDDNMNWKNIGSYWQIDHILPINKFNFSCDKNKRICFNWTNLQPIQSSINREKSDKLHLHHYFNSIISIIRFNTKYKQFLGYQAINESLSWLRKKLKYGKNPPDNTMDNPQPNYYL